MAKRFYNLEKETKEYLKACEAKSIVNQTNIKTLNDFVINRKTRNLNASFLANSPIILNGLVLWLDAGVSDSYPAGGTVWIDLAGSNNGTLVNGPTFSKSNGGSLVFNGVNSFVRVTLPSTTSYNTFTYNSWIYATNNSGYRTIIDQDNDNWGLYSSNGELVSWDPQFGSGYIFNLNQWYNAVMSHTDGGPVLFYVNGSLVYTSSNSSTNHTTSYFGIGAGILGPTNADEFWSGNISQVSIYNRELTAPEILQNYNATKSRFLL